MQNYIKNYKYNTYLIPANYAGLKFKIHLNTKGNKVTPLYSNNKKLTTKQTDSNNVHYLKFSFESFSHWNEENIFRWKFFEFSTVWFIQFGTRRWI